MDPIQISDESALDATFAAPFILLFKHSLVCPISARAFEEYRAFLSKHPDVATGWLDVIGSRPLSLGLAERTGVKHESPQALLLEGGVVRWHASHQAITVASLEEAWGKSAAD